ncbi:MAG: hypothetical protein K6D02_01650 [Lachnospiraceae bacterium]|nr:hypothetical protein [Lachnospiraceae bacterium]
MRKQLAWVMAAALTFTVPAVVTAAPGGDAPGGSSSSSSVTYSGATTYTSATETSGQTYSSTTADENAVLINTSDTVTLTSPTVTKSGDSDGGDNCNFYGINSAITAMGGGTTYITGADITATAKGANGVFSYGGNGGSNGTAGDGTCINISDSTITTSGDNGGGIMTTGGGETVASNLTISTSGQSSAPIRTDRGGGTCTVTGGTYTSSGLGSPAIYSTAAVTVSNATLTSNKSEGVCIEGENSITLNNCTLTATNSGLNGNATFYDTIMIYQSQSGDAADGTSSFTMTGGNLISNNGDVFHVTNTNAIITLDGVGITNNDSENVLLSVCDDGWSGASNVATLNATDQALIGDLLVGSDSTLTLNLSGSSTLLGKTSGNITNDKSSTISSSIGTVDVTLGSGTIWQLTGDCTVSSISGSGSINYNGYTLTVGSTSYTSGSPGGSVTETTEEAASESSTSTDTDPSASPEASSDASASPAASEDASASPAASTSPSADASASPAASASPSASSDASSDTTSDDTTTLKSVTFKNVNKKIKYKVVKKKIVKYSVIKQSGGGKVTYKVTKGKKKFIKVTKKGVVIVKKGAKKGIYKVKITVAKKGAYKKTTKVIKLRVK